MYIPLNQDLCARSKSLKTIRYSEPRLWEKGQHSFQEGDVPQSCGPKEGSFELESCADKLYVYCTVVDRPFQREKSRTNLYFSVCLLVSLK